MKRACSDHPDVVYHEFSGKIILVDLSTVDRHRQEFEGKEWLENHLRDHSPVGFDTEWRPDRKGTDNRIALIQFADSTTALLFRTHRSGTWLPDVVKKVLVSEVCHKICVAWRGDNHKMQMSFNLEPSGIVDLQDEARQRNLAATGLKKLASVFKLNIKKAESVTRSPWDGEQLSDEQIKYAADDAHFTFRVYNHLKRDEVPASAFQKMLPEWSEEQIDNRDGSFFCDLCRKGPMQTGHLVQQHIRGKLHVRNKLVRDCVYAAQPWSLWDSTGAP